MIYLDSAATSFQKPRSVHEAVSAALETMSSPGRGSYSGAMRAAELLYDCRELLARMFHASAEQIVFCSSATHALNIAVHSLVHPGDRVVISGYEHNAVLRPLHAARADIDTITTPVFDSDAFLRSFSEKLPGANAVFCTHVSNVFGYILPIEKIALLCREQGIPLVIDASQSAGILPLDFKALGAAFMAMPGHKGLLGPQGSGVLIVGAGTVPLIYGGTGSHSESLDMPEFLPDRLEAGTHNMPAVAGLYAGLQWLERHKSLGILHHEQRLMQRLAENMENNRHLRMFLAPSSENQCGVVSVIPDFADVETLADKLARRGICVRAGLHCAPLAHKTAGTFHSGTLRFSFSPFNTVSEIQQLSRILWEITA